MSISRRIIRVRVLDDPHRPHVLIPKIRFKFRLKYGQSYKMMRCQFPVRLVYFFTYNRAQGQTLHKVLLAARVHLSSMAIYMLLCHDTEILQTSGSF